MWLATQTQARHEVPTPGGAGHACTVSLSPSLKAKDWTKAQSCPVDRDSYHCRVASSSGPVAARAATAPARRRTG